MPQETHKKFVIDISAEIGQLESQVKEIDEILNKAGVKRSKTSKKSFQEFEERLKFVKKQQKIISEQSTPVTQQQKEKLLSFYRDLDKTVSKIDKDFQHLKLPASLANEVVDLAAKIKDLQQQLRDAQRKVGYDKTRLIQDSKGGYHLKYKTDKDKAIASVYPTGLPTIGSTKLKTYEDVMTLGSKLSEAKKQQESGQKLTPYQEELIANEQKITEVYKAVNQAVQDRIKQIQEQIKELEEQTIPKLQGELEEGKKSQRKVLKKAGGSQEEEVIDEYFQRSEQREKTLDKVKETLKEVPPEIDKNTNAQEKNTKSIKKSIGAFIKYNLIINTFKRVLRSSIQTVTQMDEAMTGMAVVTSMNRQETWKLLGTWQDLASQTGKTTSEIASMATKFYQQGRSTSEVISLTEAAAKAATIAGIDGSRSIDLLTNAINGFQLSASQAMEVSDKFAALAATAATDYEELATALSKVAAQANLAGMSMDFTLGLLTKGIETTREAPETIGTALKTVVSRMRELSDYGKTLDDNVDVNRVAKALSNVGIELMDQEGQFRDLESVLTEVGNKWDTLTTNQQANIAVAMAGTRQQSRFIAMMQDFDRTLELSKASANSYGATLAQSAEYMEGLQAKITLLKNSWEKLVTSETVTNVLIKLIEGLTSAVGWLSDNLMAVLIPAFVLFIAKTIASTATIFAQIEATKELAKQEGKIVSAEEQWQLTEKKGIPGLIAKIKLLKDYAAAQREVNKAKKGDTSGTGDIPNTGTDGGGSDKDPSGNIDDSLGKIQSKLLAIELALAAIAVIVYGINNAVKQIRKTATDYANEGIESLKEMQVELYNIGQKADKVSSLADSFDELSRKVNKSTEDLKELQSVAEQINEEAGKQVVDLNSDIATQRKQILAYQSSVKLQEEAARKGQKDAIATGYKDALAAKKSSTGSLIGGSAAYGAVAGILGALSLIFLGAVTGGAGIAAALAIGAVAGGAIGATGGAIGNSTSMESEDQIKEAYVKQLKETEAGKNTFKQAFLANNKEVQNASAAVQEILVSSALNSLTKDSLDAEGNLKLDDIYTSYGLNNTKGAKDIINRLDKVTQSSKLSDYLGVLKGLEPSLQAAIKNSNTLVGVMANIEDESNAVVTNIDSLNFSLNQLQLIFESIGTNDPKEKIEALGDAFQYAKDKVAQMGYEWDSFSTKGKQALVISGLADAAEKEYNRLKQVQENYLTKVGGEDNVQKITQFAAFLDETDDNKGYNRLFKGKGKTGFYNKEVAAMKAQFAGLQVNVDGVMMSIEDFSDNLSSDDPTWQKFIQAVREQNKELVTDQANLDLAKQSYEDLADSVPIVTIQEMSDAISLLNSRMTTLSKINDKTISGIEKFELMAKYPELTNKIAKGIFSVGDALDIYKEDFGDAVGAAQASITTIFENKLSKEGKASLGEGFNPLGKTSDELRKLASGMDNLTDKSFVNEAADIMDRMNILKEMGYGAFIELGEEQMQISKDNFKKYGTYVGKAATELERLIEDTDEYKKKQEELNNTRLLYLSEGQKRLEEIENERDKYLEGMDKKVKEEFLANLEEVNGQYILKSTEFMERYTDEEKAQVKTALGILTQSAEESKEVLEAMYSTASDMATQLTDKLQKQRDAYEEYFDEIDKLEEEEETETERNRLLSQIQSLTGAFDSTSKSRLKELKKQLQDLEKQQLETQREEERNSLLSSIDKRIENASNAMKMLTTAILSQQSGKDYSDAEKTNLINALNYLGVDANTRQQILGFSNGGYVKDTGLVMVHGSQSRPEAFLDAVDTQNMRILLDTLQQNLIGGIRSRQDAFDGQNNISIGQISIQTNQLNNAQDFGEAGKALAQEFSRAIQQRGINVNVKR